MRVGIAGVTDGVVMAGATHGATGIGEATEGIAHGAVAGSTADGIAVIVVAGDVATSVKHP